MSSNYHSPVLTIVSTGLLIQHEWRVANEINERVHQNTRISRQNPAPGCWLQLFNRGAPWTHRQQATTHHRVTTWGPPGKPWRRTPAPMASEGSYIPPFQPALVGGIENGDPAEVPQQLQPSDIGIGYCCLLPTTAVHLTRFNWSRGSIS